MRFFPFSLSHVERSSFIYPCVNPCQIQRHNFACSNNTNNLLLELQANRCYLCSRGNPDVYPRCQPQHHVHARCQTQHHIQLHNPETHQCWLPQSNVNDFSVQETDPSNPEATGHSNDGEEERADDEKTALPATTSSQSDGSAKGRDAGLYYVRTYTWTPDYGKQKVVLDACSGAEAGG